MVKKIYFNSLNTTFGEINILWTGISHPKILRILLPSQKSKLFSNYASAIRSSSPKISKINNKLLQFLNGEHVKFSLMQLNLDLLSEFQRKVILAEYEIPRGFVSTYGRIARQIGSPKSSRAVGRALATNLFPLIIPCHRAIRSNGELGGYQGGLDMKKKLLELEGIQFRTDFKVEINKIYY
jgi:methylated-DNA-[protein]-cysteine S-methyltransferase